MAENSLPGPTLDEARHEVGRILSDHFAEDRINVDEFERRLELTFKATTVEGVRAQLEGIADAALAENESQQQASRRTSVAEYQPSSRSKTFIAFMSGVGRRGAWSVPQSLNVIACMGGVELDLRHARLGPGTTNIRVFAFMGGAEITVPSDIRVETDGIAIMGGFDDRVSEPAYVDPNAPVIRITGVAFMGGVEVRVKAANPTE